MKQLLLLSLLGLLVIGAGIISLADFEDSLHYTRAGKGTWYSKDNGGFELLTGYPMDSLSCTNCHAATKADGTPIDSETYEPDCFDCHNPANGFANVDPAVCLGCHSRQGAEISLSQHPVFGPLYTDVHRDAGMTCIDCHTYNEMHGDPDGTQFISMFEDGATEARCGNEGCHAAETGKTGQIPAHDIHMETVDCAACHAKTVTTCYNCHFETELEIDKKRFYGPPPMGGFVLLVNDARKGKVGTASFQALTYGDTTFYAVGPFGPHTITADARACSDCHQNDNVTAYNETGKIDVVRWNEDESKLVPNTGIIPATPDWSDAWQLDFVRYLGSASDPIDSPGDPTKWAFMKDKADLTQMLYASPLTEDQMAKLSANVTATEAGVEIPTEARLFQNYPNPFNPSTTISFFLPEAMNVRLTLYDALGREIDVLMDGAIRPAGEHSIALDASRLSSGTYLYRLDGPDIRLSRTLTVIE